MESGRRQTRELTANRDRQAAPLGSSSSPSSIGLLTALVVVVSILVLFAHWPAPRATALSFDDQQYLMENRLVQNPGWHSAGRFLGEVWAPSTVPGYYQPLTMISLMLDCAMGGSPDNLVPFHRVSLALHVANTALVIILLYSLLGHAWAAAMAGLLFGVHPMTVEPIPWIGERKTLLATFFILWCLLAYVRYARTTRRGWYGAALAMFVLALGKQDRLDEAVRHCGEAVRLNPAWHAAHKSLGALLERRGDLDAAAGEYHEALRLRPQDADLQARIEKLQAGQKNR